MKVEYTLDELVAAVAARLAAAGLDRQANGQVSAFPDRRTLRYYTTIGLMGRPDAVKDRQAIYGSRHLAQAVAVKRLQAEGLPLAAIQGRLAGLPPAQVEAIASGHLRRPADVPLPAAVPAAVPAVAAAGAAARPSTGLARAAHVPALDARAAAPDARAAAPDARAAAPPATGPRFWTEPPAETPFHSPAPLPVVPAAGSAHAAAPLAPHLAARPMLAIPLSPDATLLLASPRPLTAADVADLRGAAAALLHHLDQLAAAEPTGADLDRKDYR